VVVASVLAVVTIVTSAGVSRGDLASRYSAGRQRANELNSAIHADSTKIQGFEGTISSLQASSPPSSKASTSRSSSSSR
jgi:hypothetical protein